MSYIIKNRLLVFLIFLILFNIFLSYRAIIRLLINGEFDFDEVVPTWHTSAYLFSYLNEFSKRALIGTLFDLLNISITKQNIYILSLVFGNLIFIIFYTISNKIIKCNRFLILFLMLFIFSTSTAFHFGTTIGRLDIINTAAFFMIIYIIMFYKAEIKIVSISLLISLSLLIHEAFLFIHYPVLIAIIHKEFIDKELSMKSIIFLHLITISTIIPIMIYGKVSTETLNTIQNTNIIDISQGSLNVWRRSIIDNIAYVFSTIHVSHIIDTFKALIVLLGYYYLYQRFIEVKLNKSNIIVFYSFLSILPMFILGHDYTRWIAMIVVNLFALFLYFSYKYRPDYSNIEFNKLDKIIYILLISSVFLGPMKERTFFWL